MKIIATFRSCFVRAYVICVQIVREPLGHILIKSLTKDMMVANVGRQTKRAIRAAVAKLSFNTQSQHFHKT